MIDIQGNDQTLREISLVEHIGRNDKIPIKSVRYPFKFRIYDPDEQLTWHDPRQEWLPASKFRHRGYMYSLEEAIGICRARRFRYVMWDSEELDQARIFLHKLADELDALLRLVNR